MMRPRDPLAVIARPSCSECRSAVVWVAAADLRPFCEGADLWYLDQVLGIVHPDSDAWACTACSAWGVLD